MNQAAAPLATRNALKGNRKAEDFKQDKDVTNRKKYIISGEVTFIWDIKVLPGGRRGPLGYSYPC